MLPVMQCPVCPHGCAELVRRARDGDRAAADELCRAFQGPVSVIVRKWLHRHEDREDCSQEILFRMLSHLAAWQGRAPFCHYMNVVARRRALDWRRRKTSTVPLDHDPLGPDRVILAQESKEELRRTIRFVRAALAQFRPEVRPKLREACRLRRRGVGWNEVAGRLGVPISTVYHWMHQLRQRLGPRYG
jgi:RNA polymerase sigma factor (sigma-70 family)